MNTIIFVTPAGLYQDDGSYCGGITTKQAVELRQSGAQLSDEGGSSRILNRLRGVQVVPIASGLAERRRRLAIVVAFKAVSVPKEIKKAFDESEEMLQDMGFDGDDFTEPDPDEDEYTVKEYYREIQNRGIEITKSAKRVAGDVAKLKLYGRAITAYATKELKKYSLDTGAR